MTAQGSVYSWCGCRDQRTGRRLGSKCQRREQPGHGSLYVSVELPAGPGGNRRRILPDSRPALDVTGPAGKPSLATRAGLAQAAPSGRCLLPGQARRADVSALLPPRSAHASPYR